MLGNERAVDEVIQALGLGPDQRQCPAPERRVEEAIAAQPGGSRRRAKGEEELGQLPRRPGHEGDPRPGEPRRGGEADRGDCWVKSGLTARTR